jgi:branched-chain amino acid transport system permease protein
VFAVSWDGGRVLGLPLTGRLVTYYFVIAVCAALFLAMSRFVDSPLGRTLQAVRDNELRAEALGYRTFVAQLVSSSFASVVATVLGGCYAMWVRYVNPESTLGIPIMLDVLLMVIIGGIGTLYGGIIGAAFLLTARTLLPDLKAWSAALYPGSEVVLRLSERWLLYFGILFVLVVFFFPRGVLGTFRERLARPRRDGASRASHI